MPNSKLLTISEAASFIGVSAKTLRRWEERGTITPIRNVLGQRRYSTSDLIKLKDQKGKPLPTRFSNNRTIEQFQPKADGPMAHTIHDSNNSTIRQYDNPSTIQDPRSKIQDLLSISAAASKLGVSIKTLRRWSDAKIIATHRNTKGEREFSPIDIDLLAKRRKSGEIIPPPLVKTTQNESMIHDPRSKRNNFSRGKIISLPGAPPPPIIIGKSSQTITPHKNRGVISFLAALAIFLLLFGAYGNLKQTNTNYTSFVTQNITNAINGGNTKTGEGLIGKILGITTSVGSAISFEDIIDENFNLGLTGYLEANQLKSTTTSGAPITVNSQQLVTNLNADLLDGKHYADIEALIESSGSLQAAYNSGSAITTTSSDLSLTFSDQITDANFLIKLKGDTSKLIVTGNADETILTIDPNAARPFGINQPTSINGNTTINGSLTIQSTIAATGTLNLDDANTTSSIPFSDTTYTTLPSGKNSILHALNSSQSLFTDNGTITYLTQVSEDLAIGGTGLDSAFSVDVSDNKARIGKGSGTNAQLEMFASDGAAGILAYTTSDAFNFQAGNVIIDQTLQVSGGNITGANSEVLGIGTTDDLITFTGNGGTNNTDLYINLDGAYPTIYSNTDSAIGINDNLTFVGARTISNTSGNLTLTPAGSLVISTLNCSANANGGTLTADASGIISCSDDDAGAGGTNYWRLTDGALSPYNDTLDFLVGSAASSSAKFAVLNVNSGTPTASVSAGTTGAAYLTADGSLQTTANQSLILGGSTTGAITLSENTTITGTTTLFSTLTLPNSSILIGDTTYLRSSRGLAFGADETYYINSSGNSNLNNITASQITDTGLTANKVVFTDGSKTLTSTGTVGADQGGTGLSSYTVGDLIYASGTTTLASLADVATGNALISGGVGTAPSWGKIVLGTHTTGNYVSSLTGTANQLTVSASTGDITISVPSDFRAPGTINATSGLYTGAGAGTQRVDASGNLTNIGTTGFNGVTYTWPGADAAGSGYALTSNGAGTLSWSSVATDANIFWGVTNGALVTKNQTTDVLIGGTASSSAKFAFLNVNSGTPTASVSAGTTGATYLTADGSIGTTAKQNLNIGGTTTGNVNIRNSSGTAFTTFDTANGRVGIGTATPNGLIDIKSASDGDNFIRFSTTGGTNPNFSFRQLTSGSNPDLGLYSADTNIIQFFDAGVDTVQFPGEISLGTFNTNNKLTVRGGVAVGTNVAYYSGTAPSNGMIIEGIVGIGTISPAHKLDVSSSYAGNALTTLNETGNNDIFTASASGTTRFVIQNDGDVGIGTNSPDARLEVNATTASTIGAIFQTTDNSTTNSLTEWQATNGTVNLKVTADGALQGTANATNSFGGTPIGNSILSIKTNTTSNVGLIVRGTTGQTANLTNWQSSGGTTTYAHFDESGNLRLGSAAADAGLLNITGAYTGKALAILNETGDQDIFTASASGVTRFTVANNGELKLYDSDASAYVGFKSPSSLSSSISYTLPSADGSNGYVLTTNGSGTLTWSDVASLTSDMWNRNSNVLSSSEYWSDSLALGGTSSASASIVLNSNGSAVFNEQGNDADFRIEGDTDANLFFADASTDRIGIGTNSPGAKLEIQGEGAGNIGMLIKGGTSQSGDFLRITDSSGALEYFSIDPTNGAIFNEVGASSADLRIEGDTDANLFFTDASTDRIGIGTNTPGHKLEIEGQDSIIDVSITDLNENASLEIVGGRSILLLDRTTDGTNINRFGFDSISGRHVIFSDTAGTGTLQPIVFGIDGSATTDEALRIDTTKNVGIGTTSPAHKLHVSGGYAGNALVALNDTNGNDLFTASASGTTRFVIQNNGDVGIGTNTPASHLNISSGTNTKLFVDTTHATANTQLGFRRTGVAEWQLGRRGSDGSFRIGQSNDLDVSNALTILTSGNLGLGTTTPGSKLDIINNANDDALTITANATQTNPILRIFESDGTTENVRFYPGVADGASSLAYYLDTVNTLSTTGSRLFALRNNGTEKASFTYAGDLALNSQADLRLYDSDTTNYTGFQAPATLGSDIIYTLPSADGSGGYVLSTNGSGTLSWTDASSLGSSIWNHADHYAYLDDYWQDDLVIGGNSTASADIQLYADGSAVFNDQGNDADFRIEASGQSNAIFVDGTTGRIGLGTSSPTRKLHMNVSDGESNYLAFTNTDTGTASTDGSILGLFTDERLLIWNQENTPVSFASNNTERLRISAAGGISIGSTYVSTDPGNGSMIVSGNVGIGTTSPVDKLTVFNGDLTMQRNDTNAAEIGFYWGGSTSYGGRVLSNVTSITSYSAGYGTLMGNIYSSNQTSSAYNQVEIRDNFNPTSGTAITSALALTPTINQTGGANGITRGLYVNPTLTAAADWRGIEIANTSGYGLYQSGVLASNYLAGNTGIGTTSPAHKLHVSGGYAGNALVALNDTNGNDLFTASASGTTRFIIQNDGDVGIGTGAPTSDLDIVTAPGEGPRITLRETSGGTSWQLGGNIITGSADEFAIYDNGNSATRFIINSSGNVGLGTATTPASKLQVSGSYGANALVTLNETSSTNDIFTASASGTTRFVIQNDGDVGIGTNNPTQKLTISGGSILLDKSRSLIWADGSDEIRIDDAPAWFSGTDNVMTFETYNGGAGTGAWVFRGSATDTNVAVIRGDTNNFGIGSDTTPDHRLQVSGGYAGNALMALNETNGRDVFTASASGTTRLTLTNAGSLNFNQASTIQTTTGALSITSASDLTLTKTGNLVFAGFNCTGNTNGGTLTVDASGIVSCSDDDAGSASVNYWQLNDGALSPISLTTDINLGATATASAKISLAGSLTRGLAAVIVNQTEDQDIITASSSGVTRLTLSNIGNLGIGTSLPTSKLQVSGGYGGNALATFNNTNGTDIITASSSGTTRFRVDDSGYTHSQRFADLSNSNYFIDPAATDISMAIFAKAGIGTTAPVHQLQVTSGLNVNKSLVAFNETTGNDIFTASSSGSTKLTLDNSGNVGVGNVDPTGRLDIATQYGYERSVSISNSGSTLNNQDVLVQLDTQTLISNSKLNSDCSDLRFTSSDRQTKLIHWIESGCNTTTTQVWIRVPSIPNGTSMVYLNYGNTNSPDTQLSWTAAGTQIAAFNATCPAGWTSVTTLNTDNRFPIGATTYGSTGGSTTHTHGYSDNTGNAANNQATTTGAGTNTKVTAHVHSLSGTSGTGNNVPPYRDVVYCSYDAGKFANTVTTANLGFFEATPSGWTIDNTYNDYFVRGNTSAGTTGGSYTHSHSISGSSGNASGANQAIDTGADNRPTTTHTHNYSATSDDGDINPPYYTLVLATPNATATLPEGTITMFTENSLPPLGWSRFTALDGKFIKGHPTTGTTGGAAHDHGYSVTTGGPVGLTTGGGSGTTLAGKSHTHSVTSTTDTDVTNPPYMEVVFYKKTDDGVTVTVNSEATNTQSLTEVSVTQSGRLSVGGSNTPSWKLTVEDISATASASIANRNNIATSDAVGLQILLGMDSATNPDTGDRFINFMKGDGTIVGKIQGNGTGGVSYTTSGVDFAEYFKKNDVSEVLEPGDLICHGDIGVTKCGENKSNILGIISNQAGFVGGGDKEGNPEYALVGIVGQLGGKVSTNSGVINIGDPLTYSSIEPGTLIKAVSPGIIVGHALSSYSPEERDESILASTKVDVSIKVFYFDPNESLMTLEGYSVSNTELLASVPETTPTSTAKKYTVFNQMGDAVRRIGTFSDILVANLTAGYIKSESIESNQIATSLITPIASGSGDLVIDLTHGSSIIDHRSSDFGTLIVKGNASVSGELIADSVSTDEITANTGYFDELVVSTISAKTIAGLDEELDAKLGSRLKKLEDQLAANNSDNSTIRQSDNDAFNLGDATTSDSTAYVDSSDSNEPDLTLPSTDLDLGSMINNQGSTIYDLSSTFASASADLSTLAFAETDGLYVADFLAVGGLASIVKAEITDYLTIGGTLLADGNSLSTTCPTNQDPGSMIQDLGSSCSNTLFLQPLGGSLNLLAGLMTLDGSGVVQIQGDLVIAGKLNATSIATNTIRFGNLASGNATGSAFAPIIAATNDNNLELTLATNSAFVVRSATDNPVAQISASGSATFNSLTLKDNSGTATILAGEKTATISHGSSVIDHQSLTDHSQILVTFEGDYAPATRYWVTKTTCDPESMIQDLGSNSCTPSFTIHLDYPVTTSLKTYWAIIN